MTTMHAQSPSEFVRAARWVAFVERWHRTILLVSVLVSLLSALSLFALRLDFDVLEMLPTGRPAFDNFKTFVAEFGELDQLVILLDGSDPSAVRVAADGLAMRLQQLDSVQRVQSKFDVKAIEAGLFGALLYNYVPAEGYAQLRERLTPAGIDAQVKIDRSILQAPMDLSMVEQVRADPLGVRPLVASSLSRAFDDASMNLAGGYLSSRDGNALLILVRPTGSAFDIPFTSRFMAQVDAAATAAVRAVPDAGIRVAYTGSYAYALEDAATIRWDVARYSLLALVGVLAIFYLAYRDLRILPFVTFPLVLSTLVTFAASLLWYTHLNAVSLSFASILYGMSLDSGVHYFTRFSQERARHDLRTAVTRTLAELGGANLIASATTAAVFWVIGFSQLAGVSQLGQLTGLGMMINIAEFFILYPALSFWMSRPTIGTRSLDTPRLGRMATACAAHARMVVWSAALCTILLAVVASRVELDVDLTHLRPTESSAVRVENEIATRFGAADSAGAVLVTAPALEDALQASERVERRLRAYRDEQLIRAAWGITTLLPSVQTQRERLALFDQLPRQEIVRDLQQALQRHGFRPEQFAGFTTDFLRPRTALVTWPDASLEPFTQIIARHVRGTDGRFTIATYVQPAEGVSLSVIDERLRADLPGEPLIVAGRGLLQEELGRMLRRELVGFFLAAFALNFVLVLMSVRHLGTAAAVLLPQGVVIVCCLALMEMSGAGIGPVNIIVIPIILGIGVDHCVYLAERWQHGESLGNAVAHGGRAVVVSALTTAAGFGFLGLSRYPALANMGILAAVSLVLCLVAAVTLFPALLAQLAPAQVPRQEREAPGPSPVRVAEQ